MTGQQVIELELSTMAHGGEALGHWQGKVVFVPGAVPGEVVRARIVEDRKRWARADLLGVLTASPHRVEPPCPHFAVCGGCQWQHISYEAQLCYKRHVIIEQLQHLGHIPVRRCAPRSACASHGPIGTMPSLQRWDRGNWVSRQRAATT